MNAQFLDPPHLPNWLASQMPFARRAIRIGGRRIHFVDEGEGPVVLLVHGNPTWSYLWRKVITSLQARRNYRVIAPDLFGFGLSDKPSSVSAHHLRAHVDTIAELVDRLGTDRFISVGQDWGGPIAAGVARSLASKVRGLVFGNTAVLPPKRPFRPALFHRFSHVPVISDLCFRGLLFPIPVMNRVQGRASSVTVFQRAAYAWPLRKPWERSGPLGLARMVPSSESHPSTAALDEIGGWVQHYRGPTALVWGTRDPILGRSLGRHRRALPHASVRETSAGHFLQEEVPDQLAAAIEEIAAANADAGSRWPSSTG